MKSSTSSFKLALFLAVVSAFAGLVISFVNDITSPIIFNQNLILEKKNLEKMFPDSEFVLLHENLSENILAIYQVPEKGYVVKAKDIGYNASTPIVLLLAFDNEGRTIGLSVLQHQETSGFGASCFEDEFIQSVYIGKKNGDVIDGYTGATKTSNALRRILNYAFNILEKE